MWVGWRQACHSFNSLARTSLTQISGKLLSKSCCLVEESVGPVGRAAVEVEVEEGEPVEEVETLGSQDRLEYEGVAPQHRLGGPASHAEHGQTAGRVWSAGALISCWVLLCEARPGWRAASCGSHKDIWQDSQSTEN